MPTTEQFEPWYWTLELGYAWIGSFRPYMYWTNTTNCFHRILNLTYQEIPEFQETIAQPRLSVYEKMENMTFLIQNITTHLWFCNSAFTTASRY